MLYKMVYKRRGGGRIYIPWCARACARARAPRAGAAPQKISLFCEKSSKIVNMFSFSQYFDFLSKK